MPATAKLAPRTRTATKAKPGPKPRAKAKAAAKPETLTAKARDIYAKGGELATEVGAFTKANALALGAAGKIFGAGVKKIGTEVVDEGKVAVATVKGDFAELKAIRSPIDLVKLQSKVLGRNIGAMTAFGIRHTDGMIKLVEASALPIVYRFDAAIKTFKKAA